MMSRKSVLTVLCTLMSVLSIGALASCEMPWDNSQTESSANGDSVTTESSEEIASSEEESLEEVVSSEDVESAEIEESSDAEESSEEDIPEEDVLTFTVPEEDAVLYIDAVKRYLQAGEGAKVSDYYQSVETQAVSTQIKWKYNASGVGKFLVEYGTKADYSDAVAVEAGAAKRFVEVYNLYKATTYYVRISAIGAENKVLYTCEGQFDTTSLGPRFMYVDDVRNMRDLGGYETSSGETLVQGIAYRSGALTPPPDSGYYFNELSEDGKTYMSEVLGIKTEIDFRTEKEAGVFAADGSVIPGATLQYITLNGYHDTFQYDDEYRALFAVLAEPSSYPLIMHCTGGADRTGSVVYLLHTLLGVSKLECIQGFELTSFSTYGLRDTQSGSYKDYFDQFMAKLATYEGETEQEKTETWLLSIGVTQAQIDAVKGIFYGEIAIGGDNAKAVKATPVARVPEKQTLNEMFEETAQGWTIQKKED